MTAPSRIAVLMATALLLIQWSARGQAPAHLQGEMAGEPTATGVLLQSRLTAPAISPDGDVPGAPGVGRFEVADNAGFRGGRSTDWLTAESEQDYIIRTRIDGLRPSTRYFYRLVYGSDTLHTAYGETRTFRTLPSPETPAPVRFVVTACMHYARFRESPRGRGPDSLLGYPALETIRGMEPDFFIGTGDNVYYDHGPRARSIRELRKKWHEQFVQPRFVQLFSEAPTFWEKDDHDFRYDDADLTGDEKPSPELGIRLYTEQLPWAAPTDANALPYRTHRIGSLVQLWFLEGRDYRSPNAAPDGPDKTIWGERQREWLKRTLLESTAPFKLIISPTPMVGPDDARKKDNHTNIGGFRYEGTAFLEWARDHGFLEKGLYILCGDRHWQYHSIHPTGFEEFSVGALVDGNARMGRNPGDPESTDPEGLIRQPFTSPEPTGGFLRVRIEPGEEPGERPTARFEWFDENGQLLYTALKTAQ